MAEADVTSPKPALDRRRLLIGSAAVAAPMLLAGKAAAQGRPVAAALPPLPPGARRIDGLTYLLRPTGPLKLDLYLPAGPGPHPLLMWIHGGGWFAGDRLDPAVRPFVADGFAVASIDYRLSGEASFPAPLLDCKAAVRFLRTHARDYGLAPDRFIAAGPMSGAHLAAMLGVTPRDRRFVEPLPLAKEDDVQGVMALYGVYDILAWRGSIGGTDHDVPETSESRMLGGFVLDRPDLARAASPAHYVTREAAPFLLVHGRRDARVPWTQSKLMASELKLAGARCDLWIAEDGVHADPAFWSEASRARMLGFLSSL